MLNSVVPNFHTRCNRNNIRQNIASSLMSFQYAEQFWRVCQQISTLPLVHKLITRWEFSNIQVCRVPRGTTVSSHKFTSTDQNSMVLPGLWQELGFLFAKQRSYFWFLFNYSLCWGSVRAHAVFGVYFSSLSKRGELCLLHMLIQRFNQEEKWLSHSHTLMQPLCALWRVSLRWLGLLLQHGWLPSQALLICSLSHKCATVSYLRRLFRACPSVCACTHLHASKVATVVLTWMRLLTIWLHREGDFK